LRVSPATAPPGQTSPPPVAAEGRPAQILGLTIGDPVDEARKRLDPLREPVDYTPDEKEKTGRRIYWKLRETEFDWVIAWGNAEGRITRIRAVYRPSQTKPFREIGDLVDGNRPDTRQRWHRLIRYSDAGEQRHPQWKVYFAQGFNADTATPEFRVGEVTERDHFPPRLEHLRNGSEPEIPKARSATRGSAPPTREHSTSRTRP
jgi:hypothetical protein